jgi:signal transduction histidine kinase
MEMSRLWQSPLFQRFWRVAGAASIRVKVLGIVLGVILLLSLFITVQMRWVLTQALRDELIEQGTLIADGTARQADLMLGGPNVQAVEALLREKQAHYTRGGHNTLVSYIFVQGTGGEVMAGTFEGSVPAALLSTVTTASTGHASARDVQIGGETVVEIAAQLPDSQAVLRLGLSEANIVQMVDVVTWQIASITLVMVVVGLGAAFFLTWILTRPILSLVQATQAVARGDFSREVARWADDEIGDLAEAFNAMTHSLAQAERERGEREALRASYIHGVIRAQEEERKRIARELHDSTSQSLTSLLVSLRNLEGTQDRNILASRITEIRQIASDTLDEVHSLAWQLRPSVLDDLGLCVALQRHIADYHRRHGIHVDFVERGMTVRLPAEMEASIYRMVQEGLTNVARHSQAQNASILIEQRQNSVRIIIEDDGIGFDPASLTHGERKLGLQGIRERAQLFGGKLTIESEPTRGSSLFIEIPLQREAIVQ